MASAVAQIREKGTTTPCRRRLCCRGGRGSMDAACRSVSATRSRFGTYSTSSHRFSVFVSLVCCVLQWKRFLAQGLCGGEIFSSYAAWHSWLHKRWSQLSTNESSGRLLHFMTLLECRCSGHSVEVCSLCTFVFSTQS
ncbi:unnamed protein product [Urochloa humidicola]